MTDQNKYSIVNNTNSQANISCPHEMKSNMKPFYFIDNSIVLRHKNNIVGNNCKIHGNDNVIKGNNNIIYGHNNTVYGNNNILTGTGNKIIGDGNTNYIQIKLPVQINDSSNKNNNVNTNKSSDKSNKRKFEAVNYEPCLIHPPCGVINNNDNNNDNHNHNNNNFIDYSNLPIPKVLEQTQNKLQRIGVILQDLGLNLNSQNQNINNPNFTTTITNTPNSSTNTTSTSNGNTNNNNTEQHHLFRVFDSKSPIPDPEIPNAWRIQHDNYVLISHTQMCRLIIINDGSAIINLPTGGIVKCLSPGRSIYHFRCCNNILFNPNQQPSEHSKSKIIFTEPINPNSNNGSDIINNNNNYNNNDNDNESNNDQMNKKLKLGVQQQNIIIPDINDEPLPNKSENSAEEKQNDIYSCITCESRKIRLSNQPCGHAIFCVQCFQKYKDMKEKESAKIECPICKSKITQVVAFLFK